MPRDNKTPLIQKIAKQAHIAFKGLRAPSNGDGYLVADKQSELLSLVTAIRAADLKIAPRKSRASSAAAGVQSPPVTYMHICETEVFSMGVFLLGPGASIPLHDHPGMNGMLKVFTALCLLRSDRVFVTFHCVCNCEALSFKLAAVTHPTLHTHAEDTAHCLMTRSVSTNASVFILFAHTQDFMKLIIIVIIIIKR